MFASSLNKQSYSEDLLVIWPTEKQIKSSHSNMPMVMVSAPRIATVSAVIHLRARRHTLILVANMVTDM